MNNRLKPSWNDSPSWANYLAMDDDGYWYWYQYEPNYDESWGWWDVSNDNDISLCAGYYYENISVSDSLEKRS